MYKWHQDVTIGRSKVANISQLVSQSVSQLVS